MKISIERNEEIRSLRANGMTLQELGTMYGITRERVRQICLNVEYDRECIICGGAFATKRAGQMRCRSCLCETCGQPIPNTSRRVEIGAYCSPRCAPGFKHSKEGSTMRSVERGIFRRFYLVTGELVTTDYYCADLSGPKMRYRRFPTLAEAHAFRASDAWRKKTD